ncbi:transcription termination factor MTERF5, chloroplastic-like [Vigna radiata var. radiata]|uniref:Transcription termination factor MTERF5, chloroplastic-like n=1 Tax=Vigna radiata var. radiata TaxID=3916 RepID=A0A3Q0EUQ3_VIGRR|nr:transcription termination factor MTERF5, chloroplastic-like [Vigna radiata var. radiata]XP_022635448.1 transcription termination factor MTERF5, chloroplastic-like [Vigna radiata var. radiata]
MQSLKSHPALLFSLFNQFSSSQSLTSFLSFSTKCRFLHFNETTSMVDYLNSNFQFSKTQSLYISKRVSRGKFPQNPLSVLTFFKQIGFSQSQILSLIRQRPQILFTDVDKILRSKIEFFQMSGFQGPELCSFISKHPSILTHSLKKTLVPSVEAIRKILCDQKDFIFVLHRCGWILPKYKRFMDNAVFLERCGILGTHLALLLKLQPRLFIAQQSTIQNRVSRAVDLGFRENSRMLVHAIHTLSCLSDKTFERKLKLINSFGFSNDEGLQMLKRTPTLFRTSEMKLKFGMKFFLHTVMLPKSVLIHRPHILMYSMEDRVLPRYKVFQLLKSKNLCKKVPSYIHVLCLSEEMFLDKYISQFRENAEELLVAYKGHYLEA